MYAMVVRNYNGHFLTPKVEVYKNSECF